MGALFYLFSPFGFLLQLIAIVHFVKRRPDTFWIFVILFGGWLGALVYIFLEVVPDMRVMGQQSGGMSRRGRIRELEHVVLDNPAPGNYEELGGLYLDSGRLREARACFDRAITARTDSPDPFYKRGICALELGDVQAAIADLERVVSADRKYDYHRALALLAHAYAQVGENEKARALFEESTRISILSETQYNYARFLASQGEYREAQEWAQKLLSKKRTLPGYLRRLERPWFRRAQALLNEVERKAVAST